MTKIFTAISTNIRMKGTHASLISQSNQKMIEIAEETPEKPRWHIWTNQQTQQNVWGDNLTSATQKCHTITFMMN